MILDSDGSEDSDDVKGPWHPSTTPPGNRIGQKKLNVKAKPVFHYDKFKKTIEVEEIDGLDEDFLDQEKYLDQPYYKIRHEYLYGGVEKPHFVPMSRPHRAIVSMNTPRNGYSAKLTWSVLNAYYLQRCMSESEYEKILYNCNDLCLEAYEQQRRENHFVDSAGHRAFRWTTVFFACAAVFVLLLTEVVDLSGEKEQLAIFIIFAVAIALVLALGIYNCKLRPGEQIFEKFEQILRQSLKAYFERLQQ